MAAAIQLHASCVREGLEDPQLPGAKNCQTVSSANHATTAI